MFEKTGGNVLTVLRLIIARLLFMLERERSCTDATGWFTMRDLKGENSAIIISNGYTFIALSRGFFHTSGDWIEDASSESTEN